MCEEPEMIRTLVTSLAIAILGAAHGRAETKNVTWTGWFSDLGCASGRAASGVFTPTNPECAKKCIEKGAAPVFIGEEAKAIYKVKDYPSVVADLGWRLEITGKVDESAKTISVSSVKRLSAVVLSCGRQRKSGATKD
jgi:hypothetical protein